MQSHFTLRLRFALLAATGLALTACAIDPNDAEMGSAALPLSFVQEAELAPSDGDPELFFGANVLISGDLAAVGAFWSWGSKPGAVYVFARSEGTWSQQAKLTASNPGEDDVFGHAMALSGNTLLVGTQWPPSVHVFVREGTTWKEQARIDAPPVPGADFGRNLALDGDTAVIGGEDLQIYTRQGTTWTAQAKFDLPNASVALSGDTLLVGDMGSIDTDSYVHVFTRSAGVWTEQAKLAPSDAMTGSSFGHKVRISGDRALITAAYANDGAGAAYVFVRHDTTWVQEAILAPGPARFGVSAALSGDVALVVSEPSQHPTSTGHPSAWIYERSGSTWPQRFALVPAEIPIDVGYAAGADLSGDTAIVGHYGDPSLPDAHPHVAHVFSLEGLRNRGGTGGGGAGGGGAGGDGSGGAGGGRSGPAAEPEGCSCRAAGTGEGAPGMAALSVLALATLHRRRRRA